MIQLLVTRDGRPRRIGNSAVKRMRRFASVRLEARRHRFRRLVAAALAPREDL